MPKKKIFPTVRTKIILILSLLIGILGGIGVVWIQNVNNSQLHVITLTEEGFVPNKLTIKVGDKVEFKTSRDMEFWPASNLHPSHEIYSEFDPKRPLKSNESWTFTFNQAGEWGYHDHLFSYYRGTIVVQQRNNTDELSLADCQGNDSEKLKCWDQQIDVILEKQGLEEAFTYLENKFRSESLFATNCHDFAHKLGDKAYRVFSTKQDVELTAKTYYCGYGFYHGFMEKLLQQSGDIKQAQQFCDYAQEKLRAETSDAGGACFHGIGHGAVDGSDPTAWGDVKKMMEPGMKLCQLVYRNDAELYRCVTGVYNAIEILSWDPKYKIEFLHDDPFSLCNKEPENFREGCYTNISMVMVFSQEQQDFVKSAQRLDKEIPNDPNYAIRSMVISGLFHEFLRINLHSPTYASEGVKLCHMLEPQAADACIDGLSGGHMKYGEPANEYIKGLQFCASDILNTREKDICYKHILPRLPLWYSPTKARDICKQAPSDYQQYCSI